MTVIEKSFQKEPTHNAAEHKSFFSELTFLSFSGLLIVTFSLEPKMERWSKDKGSMRERGMEEGAFFN